MNTKQLTSFSISLLLGTILLVSPGCDKGGSTSGGGAVDAGEVAQLTAKVAQGDAEAAFKLGELYAANAGEKESRIEAAKWFHVAGRLGNGSAKMGLDAVTAGMPLEDQTEAERRVEQVNYPKSQ